MQLFVLQNNGGNNGAPLSHTFRLMEIGNEKTEKGNDFYKTYKKT